MGCWLIALLWGPPAAAGTYILGVGSWPTIQEGVDAASPGEVLHIEAGAYNEPIVIDKDITLQSDAGRELVTLTNSRGGPILRVSDAELTVVGVTFGSAFTNGLVAERSTVHIMDTAFVRVIANCGALHAIDSDLVIEDSLFLENASNEGNGGALCAESSSATHTLTIHRVGFTDNSARDDGGAIWLSDVRLVATDLDVSDSTAERGGGLFASFSEPCTFESFPSGCLQLDSSTFEGNEAFGDGGGAFVFQADVSLFDVGWIGNSATDGGAVALDGGSMRVDGRAEFAFSENVATRKGGAISSRGGNTEIRVASFAFNAAQHGGALHLVEGDHHLELIRLEDNHASDEVDPTAGAIYAESATLHIQDSWVGDNSSLYAGGMLLWKTDAVVTGTFFLNNDARYGALHLADGALDSSHNLFCGNAGGAVYAASAPETTTTMTNDVVLFSEGTALELGDATLTNLTIWGTEGSAVDATGTATLRNVLIGETTATGAAASDLDVRYGAWWNNDENTLWPLDGSHVFDDPLLAGVSDDDDCTNDRWWPLPGSPLLDAGDPALLDPDGGRSDIGATGGPDAADHLREDADEDGFLFLDDCDDGDAAVFPGADELCSTVGVDDNCDGLIDDLSAIDTRPWYPDEDGDWYGDAEHEGVVSCAADPGWRATATDCDDTRPDVHPGAKEIPLDGVDSDCDGVDGCWFDLDGDGHPGTVRPGTTADCSGPGEYKEGTDCDDTLKSVHPDAAEVVADGVDQDCDGGDDCWLDSDGDGFGGAGILKSPDLACDAPAEAAVGGDCNDGAGSTSPDAKEGIGDGIDQDCDGREQCYVDADHDGHGGQELTNVEDLSCSELGHAPTHTDCDDTDETVHPDMTEVPGDGVDGDCDGIETCFEDLDGDGYGTFPIASTDNPNCTDLGEAGPGGDCDDTDEHAHPGAPETPGDGVDSDCDDQEDCFRDGDGDGRGSPYLVASDDLDCEDEGEAPHDDDCNDEQPLAWTGAAETCDGVDNDCDGEDDGMGVWYVDADQDGFGDPSSRLETCEPDHTLVANGDDCDDKRADMYPGARETPNDGVDQDCSGEDKEIIAVGTCSAAPGPASHLWPLTLLTLAGCLRRRRDDTAGVRGARFA
jgi:predicted outer membrane repeat protein